MPVASATRMLTLALLSVLLQRTYARAPCLATDTCHLPYDVDTVVDRVEQLHHTHKMCFPPSVQDFKLSDLHHANAQNNEMYVTVVGTFYTGCTPGRQDFPTYQQVYDLLQQVYYDPKVKPHFVASLKGGVNSHICEAWGKRGMSNVTTPVTVVDDSNRNLHYTFFTNAHPEYVVLDVDLRVHARFPAANFTLLEKSVRDLMDKRIQEGPPTTKKTDTTATPDDSPTQQTTYSSGTCVPSFGAKPSAAKLTPLPIKPALKAHVRNPRDISFHPQTKELWVAMNDTELMLLLDISNASNITGVTRRDRAPYHYMANIAAFSFDERGNFATCQEAENNYHYQDVPNYFMGPTLYDSHESHPQVVTSDGKPCPDDRPSAALDGTPDESCFFWHDDMLHAAPFCVGIVHEHDSGTTHDNVYWAVAQAYDPLDARYDGKVSMLIRYDFEQPHGPGSLDHSMAAVRRYTDVLVGRVPGVVSHLTYDASSKRLFIVDSDAGRVVAVDVQSGRFEGPAREDFYGNYSIWSSPETTFEYSVYGCTSHATFAENLGTPAGAVITEHHLIVVDYASGDIIALELPTGKEVARVATGIRGLQGLAIDDAGKLYVAGGKNGEIFMLVASEPCAQADIPVGTPPAFPVPDEVSMQCPALPENATRLGYEINHIAHDCGYGNISDMCLGEQYGMSRETCYGNPDEIVKTDTGYGDLNTFNNDMLLMTGYLCHKCLPEVCMNGGKCSNIWSVGFTCTCPDGFAGTLCEIDVKKREELVTAPTTTTLPTPTTTQAPTTDAPSTASTTSGSSPSTTTPKETPSTTGGSPATSSALNNAVSTFTLLAVSVIGIAIR